MKPEGNKLGGAMEGKEERPLSSEPPSHVNIPWEEYQRLEQFKKDLSNLELNIIELHAKYCRNTCDSKKNAFERLHEIEKVFVGEQIDSSMNRDRVRGLIDAIVHLGHHCEDTEMKMREYIQQQKERK